MRTYRCGFCLLAFLALTSSARAEVINFEVIPNGAPTDGLHISDQFTVTDGVSFSLQNGGTPVLVKVGDASGPIAFIYQGAHAANTPAPGTNLGSYFLTDDGILGPPYNLKLSFNHPFSTIGGDIIDVDRLDLWQVQAFDSHGTVVSQQTISPSSPGAGDGTAAPWQLSTGTDDITTVTLNYTGTGHDPGFGWDNFSFTSLSTNSAVPLPPAAFTGGGTLAFLWAFGTVRRVFGRR